MPIQPISERLGPYDIVRRLPAGFLSDHYVVRRRERSHRRYQMMVQHARNTDLDAAAAMSERHLALTRRADHPSIIGMRDLVRDGDWLGVVFDLAEGPSLEEIVLHGTTRYRWEDARPLFSQLLDAVGTAHQAGLVACELFPSSVKVVEGTRVMASVLSNAQEVGEPYRAPLMGDCIYVAPEQYSQPAPLVDPRFDIYALGMLLYLMLAGREPWNRREAPRKKEQARFEGHIPSPVSKRRSIPTPVVEAVMAALAPNPERRLATTADFAAALDAAPVT